MTALRWHKSSYSQDNGSCVEVADLATGGRALRDSKDPACGTLAFPERAFAALLDTLRRA